MPPGRHAHSLARPAPGTGSAPLRHQVVCSPRVVSREPPEPHVIDRPADRFGLIATGKSCNDTRRALHDLGLQDANCGHLSIRLHQVSVCGEEAGRGCRHRGAHGRAHRAHQGQERSSLEVPDVASRPVGKRVPWFWSGCPHDTSTSLPQGSRAVAGIGCHCVAVWMDRRRRRGTIEDPARRVVINHMVCEGRGDCSTQSNWLSVQRRHPARQNGAWGWQLWSSTELYGLERKTTRLRWRLSASLKEYGGTAGEAEELRRHGTRCGLSGARRQGLRASGTRG